MIFKEYGDRHKPVIMLLHGGGVASWMWNKQIREFERDYHIIAVDIDGHGEAYQTTFTTIAKCAEECIAFVDQHFQGKIFAICGFSIGGQIAVEILSQANHIVERAIVESALVLPLSGFYQRMNRIVLSSYRLLRYRWFAKMQAKQLYIDESLFERYYQDSMRISQTSLANMIEENSNYRLPDGLSNTTAKVLVLCGGKELTAIQESAETIASVIRDSYIQKVADCRHGVCMNRPNIYNELAKRMFHVHHNHETSNHHHDNGSNHHHNAGKGS